MLLTLKKTQMPFLRSHRKHAKPENRTREHYHDSQTTKNTSTKLSLLLGSIEMKLVRIEFALGSTRNSVARIYDECHEKVVHDLQNLNKFKQIISHKHNSLMSELGIYEATQGNNNQKPLVKYFENGQDLSSLIYEHYSRQLVVNFQLAERLKYLKFFSTVETVRFGDFIDDNCYTYIMLPLSRERYFFSMGKFNKMSSMKITDRKGQELARRPIHKSYYYREFLAFERHIIGLFDDSITDMNMIQVFNDRMELKASKLFNHKLGLLYMNEFEVVLKSLASDDTYYFLDFNLNQTYSIHVDFDRSQDFYKSQSKDDVCLIGSTPEDVFILVKSKKTIKILGRKSERINREVNISVSFASSMNNLVNCRLDVAKNLVFRLSNRPQRIEHYNFESNTLTNGLGDCLNGFNYFEFTHLNDIYSVDILNKKVCFI